MQLILFVIMIYLLISAIGCVAICACAEKLKKRKNNISEGEIESGK